MAWSWCDIFALISLSRARSHDVTVARREARALAPPPPKKKTKTKTKTKKNRNGRTGERRGVRDDWIRRDVPPRPHRWLKSPAGRALWQDTLPNMLASCALAALGEWRQGCRRRHLCRLQWALSGIHLHALACTSTLGGGWSFAWGWFQAPRFWLELRAVVMGMVWWSRQGRAWDPGVTTI